MESNNTKQISINIPNFSGPLELLLDLAKSNDSLKETTNDINIVSQFLANSSDLKTFLGNPLITKEAKKNVELQ